MQFHLPTMASGLTLAFLLPQANAQTPDQAEPATQLSTVNVTAGQTKSFKSNVIQVGTFRDMAPLDNATNNDYWSTAGNGLLGVGAPISLKLAAKVEF